MDGCKVEDEVAEPAGVVLVVAVPLADEVIVTEGTSRFSMKKKIVKVKKICTKKISFFF